MSKNDENTIEDIDGDAPEETLASTEVESVDEEFSEETIPEDETNKPIQKKVAALRARHKLEDYFESKRIKEALEYLNEDLALKADKAKKEKKA
jgi:hypothetical protein